MPAVLTHKTIMLLARERVNDIRNVLQQKIDAGGANITTQDIQLLKIADETARIFSSEPRPRTRMPGVLFAEPVGADHDSYPVSQYAVLGSMGPDITGFSNMLAPGQGWVFDNIHKGTPDSNRETVNAQTCDFIMTFWDQAREKIKAAVADSSDRDAQLDWMRAYVLGHVCHIAGDVVSHPYINTVQWEQPPQDVKKFHAMCEGEMEALVARGILRRESTRSGQDWDLWWLTKDPPPEFFAAYAEALEVVYKARSSRRTGYDEFEEHLKSLGPQVMDADFIKDGYNFLRNGVVSKGYGYGYWSWWGWLSLLIVPALALPLIVAAMPRGSKIFLKDETQRTERAWMEFVSTPLFFGLPASIGYGALLGSLTTRGVEGRYWLGMVGAIVAAVLGIVTFVTSKTEDELHPGFSWPVLFGLPAGLAVLQMVLGSIAWGRGDPGNRGDRGGRIAIGVVFALPLVLLVVFFIFFGIFPGLLFPDDDAATPFSSEGFWITFAIWAILLLLAWFFVPPLLRDIKIREKPEGNIVNRRFVQLFDEATLHHDSHLADAGVPAEVYPSGRRELVKLWWTGSGDLFIRSDRYQLQFSASEDGSNPQIVPAPIAPMKLQEFLEFLKKTVKQPGANTVDLLLGTVMHPTDPDYELPSGATFGDNGDGEKKPGKHDSEAVKFKKLGTSADDTDYILYHSYKAAQSARYGERGAVPPERNLGGTAPLSHVAAVEGYEYLHNPDVAKATGSLMSIAGDFGALLSMAAVTHMATDGNANDALHEDSKGNDVQKVYQVFRNWNLDRRRVNEWRTIVAGGALSEKGASRSGYDDKMLGGNLRPGNHASWQEALLGSSQAAFDEGENTTRQLGWVNIMREWMEVNRTAGQDILGADAMKPGNPSNVALSRAMSYIFDLSDPSRVP